MPTTPISAPSLGGELVKLDGHWIDGRQVLAYLTRLGNLTGLPCITVPCGFSKNGLPIGLQIMTRFLDECTAIQLAHAYENATNWHNFHPGAGV
mgnify:CR=1 FL=1